MRNNDKKLCTRCQTTFECLVESIHLCQCSAVELSDSEQEYINSQYADCLCAACIMDLKNESVGSNKSNE